MSTQEGYGNLIKLGLLKKLKIYAGGDHPHEAQSPAPFPWED